MDLWKTKKGEKGMAVKIRLKRTGAKNKPCFRVVVADVKSQRDGKSIESLGYYDPVKKEKKIDIERIDYWLSKGAKMSETVHDLYRKSGGQNLVEKKRREKKEVTKEVKKEEGAAVPAAQ